jgi:hypothetical protein
LDGLQHWDQMSDGARFTSLVGLSSSYHALSSGALGNLRKLGTAANVSGASQRPNMRLLMLKAPCPQAHEGSA